jgi:NAD(P)-dependent dehydrogenase (short-subunit alcohol dehydrogenase family)
VLVGRSGLPARIDWERWLATHAPDDATSRRIRKVLALEQLGAEVMVASADVADLGQMRAVIAEARARFGQIHGVIHAAGVLNDGVIQLKTREAAESVLAPKVRGALVLDAVLADQALDFFVLFSSTSSMLGPVGQVDYVGANAFLNAFAHSKTGQGPTRTIALDWGVWQEVGMAARAAGAEPATPSAHYDGEVAGHPLLGLRTESTPQRTVFQAQYSAAEQWSLHEHRLADGQAVLPGTGYLEIVRAALRASGEAGPIVLDDVFFLTPLLAADTEPTGLRITMEREGPSATLMIESGSGGNWQEHARATAVPARSVSPQPRSLEAIRARCDARTVVFEAGQRTKQERYITFGPRWRSLRRIDYGAAEALGWLVLPDAFASELTTYAAHPALLDIAAHVGLPLIEGYEQSDDFYVPFSCKRVQLHAPLTQTVYSHVRYRPRSADGGLGVFDVALLDEHGAVLVEIDEFTVKRLDAAALAASQRRATGTQARPAAVGAAAAPVPRDGAPDLLRLGLTEGILPSEGAQVLHRVLAGCTEAQIVASSLDLHALMAQLGTVARPGRLLAGADGRRARRHP